MNALPAASITKPGASVEGNVIITPHPAATRRDQLRRQFEHARRGAR